MFAVTRNAADTAESPADRLQISLRELSAGISHRARLGVRRVSEDAEPLAQDTALGEARAWLRRVGMPAFDNVALVALEAWLQASPRHDEAFGVVCGRPSDAVRGIWSGRPSCHWRRGAR